MKHRSTIFLTLALAVLMWAPCNAGDTVLIPLEKNKWEVLSYRKIPANRVEDKAGNLLIKVRDSAGPLVYALDKPVKIKGLLAEGSLSGLPTISRGKKQGAEGEDDFAFRVGIVIQGDKTLSWSQRLIAPDWVERLYAIAPKGVGIDRVLFLNLANHPGPDWKHRAHPQGRELIDEEVVETVKHAGPFKLDVTFKTAKQVLGIWISCDGDDTESEFDVTVRKLQLIIK